MMTPIQDTAKLAQLALYTDMHLPLSVLYQHISDGGKSIIEGKTFTRCDIGGPAVLLALGGVQFDSCNMGPNGGDVRNMLLRPVSPNKVIGAIPVQNCRFIECRLHAIGFTGSEAFLKTMIDALDVPGLVGGAG